MIRKIMDSMIRKLYSMELEEQDRSSRLGEEMLLEVKHLLEKNKASICVEDVNGRNGDDLVFALALDFQGANPILGGYCSEACISHCKK